MFRPKPDHTAIHGVCNKHQTPTSPKLYASPFEICLLNGMVVQYYGEVKEGKA